MTLKVEKLTCCLKQKYVLLHIFNYIRIFIQKVKVELSREQYGHMNMDIKTDLVHCIDIEFDHQKQEMERRFLSDLKPAG